MVEVSGLKCVFFVNFGVEVNEGVIKIVCKYSYDKYGKDCVIVLMLVNFFYGCIILIFFVIG